MRHDWSAAGVCYACHRTLTEVISGDISLSDCSGGIADEHEPPPRDIESASGVDWSAITRAVAAGCVAVMMVIGSAIADPPPGADLSSPVHRWFENQQSTAGQWCCTVADGHKLDASDWTVRNGNYAVRVDGT